jgi:hypothetical protein
MVVPTPCRIAISRIAAARISGCSLVVRWASREGQHSGLRDALARSRYLTVLVGVLLAAADIQRD